MFDTGDALIRMLDGCQHRGPDSTGFALYAPELSGRLKLRFLLDRSSEGGNQQGAIDAIRRRLEELSSATGVFFTGGNQLRISTTLGGTPVATMVRRLNAAGIPVGGMGGGECAERVGVE